MQSIPIHQVPSQSTKVVLGNQNCLISLYQKPQGLFVDVNVDGIDVSTGTIARDAVPLISRDYAGFDGNLMFIDSQGNDDPFYSGIGSRFDLIYLAAEEYALI